MGNRYSKNLAEHPVVVLLGLIAALIAIFTCITGIVADIPSIIYIAPTRLRITETPIEPSAIEQQLAEIDQALKQSLTASIAYNAPSTMELDESATIEFLLNPAISPETLATHVTESGKVVKTSIEITSRMKAVLKSQEQDAFEIQPLHDNAEQIISGTETTKWSWFVTAKKAGLHRLTIVIYRLVKFEGQDYWREVESYKADIDVKVTFVQRIQEFDWKWIAGIVITLIGIPALWRYIDNRKKQTKPVPKPKRQEKKTK
jgi:hypothetical protein